ncbi:NAD(P)/FAD-dependent oxidoreductase [Pseudonocardia nematodicida]|uniref:NAD(P)/FAD-dependent oxidoreductase n=1 Tax=Pseudonocardia nematodicida TaxID=1206997 RepID=A0ABV1K6V1_9PSEU
MPRRVLVVGAGFAGLYAARGLERLLPGDTAELTLVSPRNYFLYSPLLPDVTAGIVEPRHIAVPLHQVLRRTRIVIGRVTTVDVAARTLQVDTGETLGWDRLVLTPGSVTRQFDVPGVPERAHGVKTLGEARYLRDHLLGELDRADALPPGSDGERRERLGVVAVGAGYSSTEVVAQLQRMVDAVSARWERVRPGDVRWTLVDVADSVLPELGPRLGRAALDVLRRRGVDVRLGVTVASADDHAVTLTDGAVVPARTLVWGAGVVANPLVGSLGLPTEKGRLVVDARLRVPGTPGVWAAGDAAAVPDLTADQGAGGRARVTPPTAQHALRQGCALARNVAASLGVGRSRDYRHHDLGLVADLGGRDALARPLGIPLTGLPAKVVTRGYHLFALPDTASAVRVAGDWLLSAVLPVQGAAITEIPDEDALIPQAQHVTPPRAPAG